MWYFPDGDPDGPPPQYDPPDQIPPASKPQQSGHIFQLKGGTFEVLRRELTLNPAGMIMKVQFTPHQSAWDAHVALVQIVKCRAGPALGKYNRNFYKDKGGPTSDIETEDFWHVDAKGERSKLKSPAFAVDYIDVTGNTQGTTFLKWKMAAKNSREVNTNSGGCWGVLGSTKPVRAALMQDTPGRETLPSNKEAYAHRFEIVAVTVGSSKESDNGIILGALHWGYQYGMHPKLGTPVWETFDVQGSDTASSQWIRACSKWNKSASWRLQVPLRKDVLASLQLETKGDSKADFKSDSKSDSAYQQQTAQYSSALQLTQAQVTFKPDSTGSTQGKSEK